MMIEPDYRAKSIKTGQWVYGEKHQSKDGSKAHIHLTGKRLISQDIQVDTLRRNTTAKFLGDIVWEGDLFQEADGEIFVVEWCPEHYQWLVKSTTTATRHTLWFAIKNLFIIGNNVDGSFL